jgi:hypothetical protein
MGHRPQAWEYLMYAGLLQVGLRDERREGESRGSPSLAFSTPQAALRHVSGLMTELNSTIREVVDCFEPVLLSRALGEPGRPGEFRLIYHLARRLVVAYGRFIDWGRGVRTAQVPRQVRRLYGILSHLGDRPMRDIEEYVSLLVAELNDAAREAGMGDLHPVVRELTCVITADEELVEEVIREMERVDQRIVK